jgi:hypothetical protein
MIFLQEHLDMDYQTSIAIYFLLGVWSYSQNTYREFEAHQSEMYKYLIPEFAASCAILAVIV